MYLPGHFLSTVWLLLLDCTALRRFIDTISPSRSAQEHIVTRGSLESPWLMQSSLQVRVWSLREQKTRLNKIPLKIWTTTDSRYTLCIFGVDHVRLPFRRGSISESSKILGLRTPIHNQKGTHKNDWGIEDEIWVSVSQVYQISYNGLKWWNFDAMYPLFLDLGLCSCDYTLCRHRRESCEFLFVWIDPGRPQHWKI